MSNERKHHAPEEKVAILRRHLIDRVPVSTLCDEHQLHPTVYPSGESRPYDVQTLIRGRGRPGARAGGVRSYGVKRPPA
jgi:hypothetical protein